MKSNRAQPTILLVDDEPCFRRALGSLLSRRGFGVLSAKNTGDAMRVLVDRPDDVDAIVTDFSMPPGPDGVAFAHEARRSGFSEPIVLVSGAELDGLAARNDTQSVDRILEKPATLEILDVLDELLEEEASK